MKKILFIILLINISSNIFSQMYLLYPDRFPSIYLTENEFIRTGRAKIVYHYELRNDTLFFKEKNYIDNTVQIAIKKGEYILYYRNIERRDCPVLYRLESPEFKEEAHNIYMQARDYPETTNKILELYRRIKMLEVFGFCCEDPLPKLKYYRRLGL